EYLYPGALDVPGAHRAAVSRIAIHDEHRGLPRLLEDGVTRDLQGVFVLVVYDADSTEHPGFQASARIGYFNRDLEGAGQRVDDRADSRNRAFEANPLQSVYRDCRGLPTLDATVLALRHMQVGNEGFQACDLESGRIDLDRVPDLYIAMGNDARDRRADFRIAEFQFRKARSCL